MMNENNIGELAIGTRERGEYLRIMTEMHGVEKANAILKKRGWFSPLTSTDVEIAKRELAHAMADAAINAACQDTEEEAREEYDRTIDMHFDGSDLLTQLNSSQIEDQIGEEAKSDA